MSKPRAVRLTTFIFCLTGYIWIGYFTVRTDFIQVVAIYSLLFGFYLFILYSKNFDGSIKIAIGGALLLRLSLLFMNPNLSDDYYRYIWDGLFLANGENPYLIMPSEFIDSSQVVPGIGASLYEQLNSPNYYTAYPPVCQFIFGLGAKFFGANIFANIVFLRIIILLAEFGSITLLNKLAKILKFPPALILIYALNPLVIIELIGNLHLEAIMVFFLLLAVYFLVKERQFFSAISFGLAVGTKLIPLICLPLLIKRMGIGKSLKYFMVVCVTVLLLFVPFLSIQSISNYFSILVLYFRAFEFNASVYYLIRWLSYQIGGGNIITISNVVLPVIIFIVVIIIAYREKVVHWQSFFPSMLICLTVYYVLSNNVHPWNLTVLVMLSVFSNYSYMLPWSLAVVLSYSAYQTFPFSENLWLVALEYLVVGGWMVYEIGTRLIKDRRLIPLKED